MGVDLFSYLPARLRTPTIEKFLKYSIASGSGVITDATVFLVCAGLLGMHLMVAHLIAVAVASAPNYLINRYWTWQQQGKNRLWSEIVPFWAMAFAGFTLSTLFVAFANEVWGTTIIVLAANLSGFGVLWLLKFLMLDKLMWKVVHDLHPELDGQDGRDGTDSQDGEDSGPDVDAEPTEPVLRSN
jgi:putative flippase GtrA